ncbi:MAG: hypothetical protein M1389_07640 [Chloroflexi bacterium]|nr:hypothetical protein [Chloroflexota bacterium]
MARTITLRLEGKEISALVFSHKVRAFLDMLREVDRSITREYDIATETSVKWIVESVRSGSPIDLIVRAVPASRDVYPVIPEQIVDAVPAGLAQIESPTMMEDLPRHFTWTALEQLQELVKPAKNGLAGVQVGTPERTVPLSKHTIDNLDRFLTGVFVHSGSVEGVLQMVSVAHGRPAFSIRDRVMGRSVRCDVPQKLLPAVLDAFNQRVVVFGRVRTNERGDVLRIDADRVEAFPREGDLPRIKDVAGAFDLTGDKTVAEHLDWLRDAS